MRRNNNIVLTGIPRAGTTLTCHLLNKLPDTVALHEPIEFRKILKFKNHQEISDYVAGVFEEMRTSIYNQKTALSRQVKGQIPDNNFGEDKEKDSGLRKNLVSIGKVDIEKNLSPDFLLVIKEPGIFTAILENLTEHFLAYAVIRNPLSVLASWNTVPFHVTKGRTPVARLDIILAQGLAKIKDTIDKQIYILSWFYDKYKTCLPEPSILRYEDVIASGGKALNAIHPQIHTLNEPLENKNLNKLYDRELMLVLGERLLNSEGAFWDFYSRESVEILLKDCTTPLSKEG
ncbi:MAG: hypothetical protein KME25_30970 [Symplocastrum torsivum CPER-KK1]|jgi:hypothetical protein|uniref:Sulfotransferase domain-containing protein n=1 Tax=Symplocastrum torsivum CPER-KK1 TaxID=450513 RepID=A0A951PT00_9CYAN|nr:hypothetical protein [Symplocastrum torsivum CPER-KK1]